MSIPLHEDIELRKELARRYSRLCLGLVLRAPLQRFLIVDDGLVLYQTTGSTVLISEFCMMTLCDSHSLLYFTCSEINLSTFKQVAWEI